MSEGRRVLVCGGREFNDYDHAGDVLREHLRPGDVVVHGAARGADTVAADIAKLLGYETEPHPARWDVYGKAAGHVRNQAMLDSGADLVLAFSGGRGTADMENRATKAGVEVRRV